jgi:ABC-type glycerol-3-phosphate transport system permease component
MGYGIRAGAYLAGGHRSNCHDSEGNQHVKAAYSWHSYDATLSIEKAEAPQVRQREGIIPLILLFMLFAFLLLPMYFMFIGSFQHINGLMAMPPRLIPLNPSLLNYEILLKYSQITWLSNTLIVVLSAVCLYVTIACATGYAFAFYKFPGKKILWMILLIGIMLPYISLVIPRYVIVKDLHLSGTLAAVILPMAFAPMYMYLARTYFETVPISLLESARLEGAGEVTILVRIVMPVSRPIVAALAVFSAIGALTDFLWQMLVLQMPARQTLLVGLMATVMKRGGGDFSINPIGRGLAMGCLLVIPLVIVFAIGNRYFVNAIGGAIKE